jgi:signal transduction histidine kinase
MRRRLTTLFTLRRPILRVQLTLLYSGLVLAIIIAVLLATNLLYRHTAARAPLGATGVTGSQDSQFDVGPALIGLAAAAIAIAGAWWLAGRFLRPLRSITSAAQNISATNLHQRLALTGPSDELTDLGTVLDQLFERLEAAFEAQRRFVANASHELRTPLAGQRTLLQVALADRNATTATLRAACEEALQLGSQQETLMDSLLTLATSERGIERWEQFDLADITQEAVQGRSGEAARKEIRIDTTLATAPAEGDPILVERLVANLVDNALLHNFNGGTVEIATVSTAGHSAIRVINTGPSVPADEVDHLFQPFVQIGQERIRDHSNGYGLGLAIVQAIAKAHGATITARTRRGGGLEIDVSFTTQHA